MHLRFPITRRGGKERDAVTPGEISRVTDYRNCGAYVTFGVVTDMNSDEKKATCTTCRLKGRLVQELLALESV